MFKIIFGILSSFTSVFGSALVCLFLFAMFEEEMTSMFAIFILSLLVIIFLISGIVLDESLRERFNLLHKKTFSYLWFALSVIALSVFAVFGVVFSLGLIPFAFIVYEILVYLLLSFWILSKKIKKLSKKTFRVKVRKVR